MSQQQSKLASMVQSLITLLQSVVEIPPSFPVKGQQQQANKQQAINNRYQGIAEDNNLKQGLLTEQEIQGRTQRQYHSSHNASRS
jgi:transcription initiation factor TFIID subunit TAF12